MAPLGFEMKKAKRQWIDLDGKLSELCLILRDSWPTVAFRFLKKASVKERSGK